MADGANRMGNFWSAAENSQPVRIWCGLAFERVAFQHEEQIKRKLGISGVVTRTYGCGTAVSSKFTAYPIRASS